VDAHAVLARFVAAFGLGHGRIQMTAPITMPMTINASADTMTSTRLTLGSGSGRKPLRPRVKYPRSE
jgi:hypothetical protein